MKKIFLGLILMGFMTAKAQNTKDIVLDIPDKTGGVSVMEAFAMRKSVRSFDTKALGDQILSSLLWAANGVNRPDGGRTAPSAMGRKDIDVYVILEKAAYLYDADNNVLRWVADGDFRRDAAGGQAFVNEVPVMLLLVSDVSRFGAAAGSIEDRIRLTAAMDAGIVSQNISMFCAGHGLGTVTRMTMDQKALRDALRLSDTQLLLLNNAVGYPR